MYKLKKYYQYGVIISYIKLYFIYSKQAFV